MSTHTSWDEGVRMNPELQPNLKIKNQTNKKKPLQRFNFRIPSKFHRIPSFYVRNLEAGLRNYKLAQIYLKWERTLP